LDEKNGILDSLALKHYNRRMPKILNKVRITIYKVHVFYAKLFSRFKSPNMWQRITDSSLN